MSKPKKSKLAFNIPSPSTPGGTSSEDDAPPTSPRIKGMVRKETEQRRRVMMNQYFDELVILLSMVSDRITPRKMDKVTTLQEAVRMIRQYYLLDNFVSKGKVAYKPEFINRGEVMNFLLDSLTAFFMLVTDNGRILYASELIASLTGHMPSRLIGQCIYNFVPDHDVPVIKSMFEPLPNVKGTPIPNTPIFTYPSRHFQCHFNLYSNDTCSASVPSNRLFSCLSYLRQWQDLSIIDEESGSAPVSKMLSCVLILGKYDSGLVTIDQPITSSDVNFEFEIRVSKEGKVIDLDSQATLILGYGLSDLVGTSFFNFIDPYHSQKVGDAISLFLKKGRGVSQPYRITSKDNRLLWIVTKGFLSYNPWNQKPDHILLQNKVLGCDEILPECRFSRDNKLLPNLDKRDEYLLPSTSSVSFQQPQPISNSFPMPSNSFNPDLYSTTSYDSFPSSLAKPYSTSQPNLHTAAAASSDLQFNPQQSRDTSRLVHNNYPSLSNTASSSNASSSFESNRMINSVSDIRQELQRKNQELFDLQRKMFEQQQLFEQERHRFYEVTNQVMNFIGSHTTSTSSSVSGGGILSPSMAIAVSTAGQPPQQHHAHQQLQPPQQQMQQPPQPQYSLQHLQQKQLHQQQQQQGLMQQRDSGVAPQTTPSGEGLTNPASWSNKMYHDVNFM